MTEVPEQAADLKQALPTAEKGEPVDTDALTRSAGRGALWQIAGGGWTTLVRLGASTVLARVLFPEDFGILGMALLARGLVQQIGALGTGTGLIAKKDVTQDDLSTAFWMGAAVQVFLFCVALAGAPLAGAFFQASAVTWVMRAVSVTFLFMAAGSVSSTLLTKRLKFGGLAVIGGAGIAIESGLAIFFVVAFDMGYWALVSAMLISSFLTTITRIIYARWLPSFCFNRKSFSYLFRYGINGLGFSVVNYFHQNVDYLLVGRFLGPAILGLYEFAYRIPHMVYVRLAQPVGGVVFPTLSKVQANDEQLAAGYLKVAKYLAFLVFPMLAGLALLARPTVAVLWGDRWMPIVRPLQILCLVAAIRCVVSPVGAIFVCKDRPDMPFKYTTVTLVITVVAVGSLGWAFGLNGVALGMLVSTLPYVWIIWLAFRMIHSSLLGVPRALLAPTAASAILGICTLTARVVAEGLGARPWHVLLCAVPAGATGYIGTLLLVFRHDVMGIRDTIRTVVGRQRMSRSGGET